MGGTLCVDHSQVIKPYTLVSTDSLSDLPREFLKKTHYLKTQPQVAGWGGEGKGGEKRAVRAPSQSWQLTFNPFYKARK